MKPFPCKPVKNVFVFGSNLAGRHGAGAAKAALKYHGAIYGRGVGLQGSAYAIPTKDEELNTLTIERIRCYVEQFLQVAKENPDVCYNLTAIGCGLAGYSPEDIAPMFKNAPVNVKKPPEFRLPKDRY